jgi:hypothetical protein
MDIWLFAPTKTQINTRSGVVWCCWRKQPDTVHNQAMDIWLFARTTTANNRCMLFGVLFEQTARYSTQSGDGYLAVCTNKTPN